MGSIVKTIMQGAAFSDVGKLGCYKFEEHPASSWCLATKTGKLCRGFKLPFSYGLLSLICGTCCKRVSSRPGGLFLQQSQVSCPLPPRKQQAFSRASRGVEQKNLKLYFSNITSTAYIAHWFEAHHCVPLA